MRLAFVTVISSKYNLFNISLIDLFVRENQLCSEECLGEGADCPAFSVDYISKRFVQVIVN